MAAAAGAHTTLASPDRVAIDLQLRKLEDSPRQVEKRVVGSATDIDRLVNGEAPLPDGLVVNPSHFALDSDTVFSPQQAVLVAGAVTRGIRDAGRLGSVVFLTTIRHASVDSSGAAYLLAEMERLAHDVAANGIRVNAVATGQVAVNRRGKPISSRSSPLGHVSLHPVEVGKAVWFLLNEDLSGGITGATLTVDRGASLLRPDW